MLRMLIRELDRRLAIIWLVILGVAVLVATFLWGLKAGGIALVVAVALLGGFDCIWTLITHPSRKRIDNRLDQSEQDAHRRATQDNPTVR